MREQTLPFDINTLGELRIPGFSIQESMCGKGLVPLPADLAGQPSEAWYQRFRDLVLGAASSRKWLPVYRLSDGEFTCMVGRRFTPMPWKAAAMARLRHLYNTVKRCSPFYSSGRPGYCESYYAWELPLVRATLAKSLAEIAGSGALCFNFSRSDLATPYVAPVCRWMTDRGIHIPSRAYYHFYHVYGLLNGPDVAELLRGRRVAVMTSNIGGRRDALLQAVVDRGASDAVFYETSRNKPALETIDCRKFPNGIDIVLLGAGVGAAQIILQLKPLSCVAIDAGFALDCWAEPSLRQRRPYCVYDDDWQNVYGTEVPEWHSPASSTA